MERAIELIEERKKIDAPIGSFKGLDITKGKGRFGPFLKWNELYINIPRRFDPENLTQEEIHELIEAKIEKEANRYIQRWEEENIALENGRWGPFIRFKKKSYKLPPREDGEKWASDMLTDTTLEQVKVWLTDLGVKGMKKAKAKKKA